jgi:CHAT domain-containing protein
MLRIEIDEQELGELVSRFERLLRAGADRDAAHALGARLHALLVAPAAITLPRGAEVAIIPDAVLGHLPFAALRDDSSYFIQRFSVRYAGSLASARRSPDDARVNPQRDRAVIVADPAYDAARFANLEALRFADREAWGIDSMYRDAAVVRGAEATRSRVLRELTSSTVFHFAGHAQLTIGDPQRSHLVLASQSSEFGDHVLYASEIARVPLGHLRLVVLSSCGTSQPTLHGRSSSRGLAQAFLDAGVRAVVASQWEANDAETARLMADFHRALRRGLSGAAALRESQLALLDDPTSSLQTWSAFRHEEK